MSQISNSVCPSKGSVLLRRWKNVERKSPRSRLLLFIALFVSVIGITYPAISDAHVSGLPAVTEPTGNKTTPLRAELGRKLFFEPRLSADGKTSCSSCHIPEKAFSDGKQVSTGVAHRKGSRNAPTIINAVFNTSQFWDGRRSSLETQALDPLINSREQGLLSGDAVVNIVRRDASYVRAFQSAYDLTAASIRFEDIGRAIATFERTLAFGSSPFDQYRYSGVESALSNSQRRGLALFEGRGGCESCHRIGPRFALFTDNEFHSLSIGLERVIARLDVLTIRLVEARRSGHSLDQTIIADDDLAELGRFAVTLNPADIGKFRTPSLRNVAVTGPYMHDGSVRMLKDAIDIELYRRGEKAGHPIVLRPSEKLDLEDFLKALTSLVPLDRFGGTN